MNQDEHHNPNHREKGDRWLIWFVWGVVAVIAANLLILVLVLQ